MREKYLPNVPFVEARYKGGKQKPKVILVRSSSTTSEEGAALAIATRWNQISSPEFSCHYILDEARTYRCVPDRNVAFHDANSKGVVSINVCYEPFEDMTYWVREPYSDVMDSTANLVAKLCLTHRIRPRLLNAELESRWRKWRTRRRGGILIRVDGAWPDKSFVDMVQSHMTRLKKKEVPKNGK